MKKTFAMLFLALGSSWAENVALFNNTTYVDYTASGSASEAYNMQKTLEQQGHVVTTFTGITASDLTTVLAGKSILVIPELEKADLNTPMQSDAKDVIKTFVENGGILIVNNDNSFRGSTLMNGIFTSYGLTRYTSATTKAYRSPKTIGTEFENASDSILSLSATIPVNSSSLPAGALPLYWTADSAATYVFYKQEGYGAVYFLAWDWYNAKPNGSADNGWLNVLEKATLPPKVKVGEISGSVSENGSTATFGVVLKDVPSNNVLVKFRVSDTTELTISPSLLTFTNGNWSTPQTITVTGKSDGIVDGNISSQVIVDSIISTDGSFNGTKSRSVTVVNSDINLNQVITFNGLSTKTYGDANFTVSATTTATGLTPTFSSGTTSVCTVSGSTVSLVSAGTCTIHADQAGDATYAAATRVSQSFTVNTKALAITGLSGVNKTYDGTNAATLGGTAALSGVVSGDESNVILGGTVVSAFADANVGTAKAITVSGYSISGSKASSYSIAQPTGLTANVTTKALTVTAAAKSKVYGDTDPTLTYTLSSALLGSDVLSGSLSRVNGENVGKYAITSTLANANYAITYDDDTLVITPKTLTITGLSGANKSYDGTNAATLSGTAALSGVVSGDESNVTLGGTVTATFADANVGTAKAITVVGYSISGSKATNYTVVQLTGLTADIIKNPPTIAKKYGKIILAEDFGSKAFDLSSHFTDPHAMALGYEVQGAQNVATLSKDGDSLRLVSKSNLFGADTVLVTATDVIGQKIQDTLFVTVQPRNDAPVIASVIADQNQLQDFGRQAIEWKSKVSDIDGDIVLAFANSKKALVNVEVQGDSLILASVAKQAGIDTLIVRYTDGAVSVRDTFIVNVQAVKIPLGAVAILNPIKDAKNISRDPTLVWARTENASQYRVELFKGDSLIVKMNGLQDTLLDVNSLLPKTEYRLVVTASNRDSSASDSVLFTTVPAEPEFIDLADLQKRVQVQGDSAKLDLSGIATDLDQVRVLIVSSEDPSLVLVDTTITGSELKFDLSNLDQNKWDVVLQGKNSSGTTVAQASLILEAKTSAVIKSLAKVLVDGPVQATWYNAKGEQVYHHELLCKNGVVNEFKPTELQGSFILRMRDSEGQTLQKSVLLR